MIQSLLDYKCIQKDPVIIRRAQQKFAKRAKIEKLKRGGQFEKPENKEESLENLTSQDFTNSTNCKFIDSEVAVPSEALVKECEELKNLLLKRDEKLKEEEEWKNKFSTEYENKIQNLRETIERMKEENFERMKIIEEKNLKILEQSKQINELKVSAESKTQALLKKNEELNSLLSEQKRKIEKFTAPLTAQVIKIQVKNMFYSLHFSYHIVNHSGDNFRTKAHIE